MVFPGGIPKNRDLNIDVKMNWLRQVLVFSLLLDYSSLNDPLLPGMTVLWREPFTNDALTPASGCRGGSNCIKYV